MLVAWSSANTSSSSVVELVVDLVAHVEVAVDEHVEQCPQQEALFGAVLLGALELEAALDLFDLERPGSFLVVGRMTHGDDPPGAHHDVDLAALELVVEQIAIVDGDVEVVAVADQLGAFRLRVRERVDHEWRELELRR